MILFLSLFFVHSAPLEMPRAEAYLCHEGKNYYLEDRYNVLDLWTSQAVVGSWYDDDGRTFTWAKLEYELPPFLDDVKTRFDYESGKTKINLKRPDKVFDAIEAVVPFEIDEKFEEPHQLPRHFQEVRYYGTNTNVVVCAFLPEKAKGRAAAEPCWQVCVWDGGTREEFEKEWFGDFKPCRGGEVEKVGSARRADRTERELLKRDVEHSVSAYDEWHFTDAGEFVVVDDLAASREFVTTLTNELTKARAEYMKVMPCPLSGTNTLAVIRIYHDREEYLAIAGEEMAWTAAYWSPVRREIVAYLPEGDEAKLLKTMRHEAFHQYLSYGASMIAASPWINEGYAEWFEDSCASLSGVRGAPALPWTTTEEVEVAAMYLPTLLGMDYEMFYGEAAERNYVLAKSVAYFLENGADEVRFKPFATMKADYLQALIETKDMKKATAAAFGSVERLKLFVNEWSKFYKRHL